MFVFLSHLLLGTILGFIMAIPVGPVNLAVMQSAVEGSKRQSLRLAFGSALAELIYALIAVNGITMIVDDPGLQEKVLSVLQVGSIPLLLFLGWQQLQRTDTPTQGRRSWLFGKENWSLGFTLNISNPGLLVAWTAATALLHAHHMLRHTIPLLITFAMGGMIGALLLHLSLIQLSTHPKLNWNDTRKRNIRYGVGVCFILFGIFQLIKFIF
jgi:L-lysine exporter family protein LysE/ArgO